MEQRYLRTPEAAKYLGLSESTLIKARWSRLLGIPFIRAGRAILYDRNDLDQWLHQNKVDPIEPNQLDKCASKTEAI